MKSRLTGVLRAGLLIALSGILFPFSSQSAPGYPSLQDDYVNDFAGLLQPNDYQALRARLRTIEKQTGIEGVIVTINSVSDYDNSGANLRSFATGLFNSWGVGHKRTNDGFMVLVSITDRECRIELGAGYGHRLDGAMKRIVDDVMLPQFKIGQYSRGIVEGTGEVINAVTTKVSWLSFYKWDIVAGVAIIVLVLVGVSCIISGKTGWGYALLAIAAALTVGLIRDLIFGKSEDGMGGGSSTGGGASGKW